MNYKSPLRMWTTLINVLATNVEKPKCVVLCFAFTHLSFSLHFQVPKMGFFIFLHKILQRYVVSLSKICPPFLILTWKCLCILHFTNFAFISWMFNIFSYLAQYYLPPMSCTSVFKFIIKGNFSLSLFPMSSKFDFSVQMSKKTCLSSFSPCYTAYCITSQWSVDRFYPYFISVTYFCFCVPFKVCNFFI